MWAMSAPMGWRIWEWDWGNSPGVCTNAQTNPIDFPKLQSISIREHWKWRTPRVNENTGCCEQQNKHQLLGLPRTKMVLASQHQRF